MIEKLLRKYPDLEPSMPDLQRIFVILEKCYRAGGKVLICGNGGSAADSEHLVGELMKGYLAPRPVPQAFRDHLLHLFPSEGDYLADHLQGALPTISLVSQTALMTAFANDVAADMIFAQQVYGYGQKGDAVIGISTSGNSRNVIHALRVGRAKGLHVIGITGRTGGAMTDLCDIALRVPQDETTEIQERHLAIYHALCAMLEQAFFPPANP